MTEQLRRPTAAETLNALRRSGNLNPLAARGESPLMKEIFGQNPKIETPKITNNS